eukprot:COSAG04_NODE_1445_length_6714_cov_1.982162_3_plen_292_part_00
MARALAAATALAAAAAPDPIRMRELGAYDISTSETTPVLWYGDLLIVEKIAGSANTIWLPGDVCKPNSTNGLGPPCPNRGSYFRIRKQALLGHGSNDPVDTGGGVNVIPGSVYKSYASAYVDESDPARPTLWVFGTNDCEGWNHPTGCTFNTSAPGDPWLPCQCPDGQVARGEIWAMWSSGECSNGLPRTHSSDHDADRPAALQVELVVQEDPLPAAADRRLQHGRDQGPGRQARDGPRDDGVHGRRAGLPQPLRGDRSRPLTRLDADGPGHLLLLGRRVWPRHARHVRLR